MCKNRLKITSICMSLALILAGCAAISTPSSDQMSADEEKPVGELSVFQHSYSETVDKSDRDVVLDGGDSIDLAGFQVGSDVQIVTVEGETVRMKVDVVDDDSIKGTISSSDQDAAGEVEFSKEQITEIKSVEIEKGEAVEKVLITIAKGIGYTFLFVLYLVAEVAAAM